MGTAEIETLFEFGRVNLLTGHARPALGGWRGAPHRLPEDVAGGKLEDEESSPYFKAQAFPSWEIAIKRGLALRRMLPGRPARCCGAGLVENG